MQNNITTPKYSTGKHHCLLLSIFEYSLAKCPDIGKQEVGEDGSTAVQSSRLSSANRVSKG